jgi:hypothetical protein
MSSTSSFKVASSTTAFGTLNSTNVNSSLVTTEKLRVSTTESDGPAGLTTKTVKLYAPKEWATNATGGVVYAFSTVKGESQTSTAPAGLAPSVFVLPTFSTITHALYACKFSSVTGLAQTYTSGLTNSGSTLTLTDELLLLGLPSILNTNVGAPGGGDVGGGVFVTNSPGNNGAPIGLIRAPASYVTITTVGANTLVATGETVELYLTYTTPSA